MWPYLLLFFVALVPCVVASRPTSQTIQWHVGHLVMGACLAATIGLRHEVGGDWGHYVRHFTSMANSGFLHVITEDDPGYMLLNWLVANLGGDVHVVNLICAGFFSFGLMVFCREQSLPWLAVLIAIPYLIIVVAMGYTRQAVAIGFFFLAIVSFEQGRVLKFIFWIAVATTFHKSAIVMAPFAMVVRDERRWLYVLAIGLGIVGLYQQFLAGSVAGLYENYWQAEYSSQGALIRVLLNAAPASAFLLFRQRFQLNYRQRRFWTAMCIACLVTLAVLFIAKSSTAVDRVALYMIPVQIFVFSRLPQAMAPTSERGQYHWQASIVALYFLIMLVWLVFAAHSKFWLPYKFYPAIWLFE